jgi:hypothetical protein
MDTWVDWHTFEEKCTLKHILQDQFHVKPSSYIKLYYPQPHNLTIYIISIIWQDSKTLPTARNKHWNIQVTTPV